MSPEKESLILIAKASRFTAAVNRRIAAFPATDQLVMVPVIRDTTLSLVEYVSFAMADYHPSDRKNMILHSIKSLEQVHARLALCHKLRLLDEREYKDLEIMCESLGFELNKFAKDLDRAILSLEQHTLN